MKFVFFGYDFSLNIIERLVADGHEPLGIMSFECDNVFNFNTRTRALGLQHNIPVALEKVNATHIDVFIDRGCEIFISAGYPFKIPPVDESKALAINFHPSLLPLGRSIMPMPYILLDHPEAAGVTVHKMTEKFDSGDILYQESFTLHAQEDVETLMARVAIRGPEVLSEVMQNIRSFWKRAQPQDETKALHWPPPSDEMRLLDWQKPVAQLEKQGRAFGRFGVLVRLDNLLWAVYSFSSWPEKHDIRPGTVIARMQRETVVAAQDGFIVLKEMQEVRPR